MLFFFVLVNLKDINSLKIQKHFRSFLPLRIGRNRFSRLFLIFSRNPKTIKSQSGLNLHPEAKERAFKKIKSIFEIAKDQNHDSIVLSAFGCGAFGNPPNDIALLFKEAIEKYEYLFDFKYIAFAIIGL